MKLIYTDIDHKSVHIHAEDAWDRRLIGRFVQAHPKCCHKLDQGARRGYASRITASIADINAFCAEHEKKLSKRNLNYQGEGLAS